MIGRREFSRAVELKCENQWGSSLFMVLFSGVNVFVFGLPLLLNLVKKCRTLTAHQLEREALLLVWYGFISHSTHVIVKGKDVQSLVQDRTLFLQESYHFQ